MQTFEDRLLAELKEMVAERAASEQADPQPTRRRTHRRRLVLAAGVVAAAGATAIAVPVISGEDGTRANAVEKRPDGSVLVTFYELAHPERVEAKLRRLDIPAVVTFIPSGKKCKPRARLYGYEPGQESVYGDAPDGMDANGVLIFPKRIRKGETLLINVWGRADRNGRMLPDGGFVIAPELTPDRVGPCVLTDHGPEIHETWAGDGPQTIDDDVKHPRLLRPRP